MKSFPLFKISLFTLFATFACNVNAEYYVGSEFVPNIVFINCVGHHCRWHRPHVRNVRHYVRHHRNNHCLEENCDYDLATGDDNPCLHPEMQIN